MPRLDPVRNYYNKWEMHKVLSTCDLGPCQLPATELAKPSSLRAMLRASGSVFIKPINGWGGYRIIRVDARHGRYDWKQQGRQTVVINRLRDVVDRFLDTFGIQPTIVQQTAPLRTVRQASAKEGAGGGAARTDRDAGADGKRPFDIRTLLQRDHDGQWCIPATVARVAPAGAVVSNVFISQGEVWEFDQLCDTLDIRPQSRTRLLQDIETVALNVAKALDQHHPFQEIGLDLGLDSNPAGGLWLIEVNTNDNWGAPSHELYRNLPNRALYREIEARSRPLYEQMGWVYGD